jgi:NADH-quinone oxidoreductase subunit L
MDTQAALPTLLGAAWLLPLLSFFLIWLVGGRMGPAGKFAGYVATGAILGSFALSAIALATWVQEHGVFVEGHDAHGEHHDEHDGKEHKEGADKDHDDSAHDGAAHDGEAHHALAEHAKHEKTAYAGEWYTLAQFGDLKLTIGYYIDALTLTMFTMVTLIASCIHFYAQGYMHDELHDITDHEVTLANGEHLHRPGRYHRFFQYLSLFCFSMLGIVVAGNMAMVFVFWELVGVCSYFLIGFYIERKSASTAANKAFIVNRVGDFGMLIGLMAIWASLGTFTFGDVDGQTGLFSLVRPAEQGHELHVPQGMVDFAAEQGSESPNDCAYWLLIVAGIGIFCGCVGKSAQFPLHVWLPDAMEGPTPVSALVHSATMVAAGVYLVGRFYPVFAPEVLLVIAVIGCITLFIAATIAITATDIKRVLAYSTVSQLGYMMFALGVGGWIAGVLHLITHAFFKSLLFMCSGSVIHAVHTNEMTEMGGLRKKMPWTAYTMLVGCLAIIGAGVPPLLGFAWGFSGYYSKDSIIAQALVFKNANPQWGFMFYVAAGGAALTAFYMFRLWYMTFAGEPRNKHRYDHAHESPKVMYVPLVVLAFFAAAVVWPTPEHSPLVNLLQQALPLGATEGAKGVVAEGLVVPAEHDSHAPAVHFEAGMTAFSTALAGFLLATVFYGWRLLDAQEVRNQFGGIYRFLLNKWYFDELYDLLFMRPTHAIARFAAWSDKKLIDGIIHGVARATKIVSSVDDLIDRLGVDGVINAVGRCTYSLGLTLRAVQTGRLRQYVMFIIVATATLFVLASFVWSNLSAGN